MLFRAFEHQADSDFPQMHVRDLLIDTPHNDKYLMLRTFAHVLEVSNMQVAVAIEDEKGEVE